LHQSYHKADRDESVQRIGVSKLTLASSAKEAEIAVDAAEKLPQVKLFRGRAYAVAINATSIERLLGY